MIIPTFDLENSLLKAGHVSVAGMDEVGRGCLAGPLVAAIVVVSDEGQLIEGVRDSKKMTELQRVKLDPQIRETVDGFGIGEVTPSEVDGLGITSAVEMAMRRAYDELGDGNEPGMLLVDGGFVKTSWCEHKSVDNGDALHYSIAAASVIAKVFRDNLMRELAEKYPGYGFEKHVGYGTAVHMAALEELGPCEIHRRSFSPVSKMV